jgi:Mycotoxin biosynthesis protein UstYa
VKPKLFEKNGHFLSPFSRPPSVATDAAWARLLEGGNMRVSQSELAHYPNATSVRVLHAPSDAGEPQYLAKMGFYHDLHCLHKLKRWLYPETYYINASNALMEKEREHLEHCIEWIRTAALCRGDTTLTLFEWVEGQLETKYPIPHQCVDDNALLGWSRREGRMVNIDIDGMIEGPGLG